MIVFNCAELMKEMAESQLFGHRRGSFTGAMPDYPGIIRLAESGTLFLDEISELSLELQPKLLRFIQEGEALPLGATRALKLDVRLIAATNCNLEAAGRFRADLYHRLNVIRLHLPPLRERRDKMPLLIAHFLSFYARQNGKPGVHLSQDTADRLVRYDWPGNVRELCHELERLVLFADEDEVIGEENLSPVILAHAASRPKVRLDVSEDIALANAVAELERQMIARALKKYGGEVLPPDPGEAGKLTLVGVDSDHDGVRDDVQRWICLQFPNSKKVRVGLRQVAADYQAALLVAGDKEASVQATRRLRRSLECACAVLNQATQARAPECQQVQTRPRAVILNTRLRSDAGNLSSRQFSGQVFRLLPQGERKNACRFDPGSLPN